MSDTQQKWKVLKALEQWDDWFDQTRSFFESINAWDYVDPEENPPRKEPTRPKTYDKVLVSVNIDIGRRGTTPDLFSAESEKAKDRAAKKWNIKQKEWNQFKTISKQVVIYFQTAVDQRLHVTINRERTLRTKFAAIQARFQPDSYEYTQILSARYKKLQKLGYNDKVNTWLVNWENFQFRAEKHAPVLMANMADDFAAAVDAFDPRGGSLLQSRRKDNGRLPDLKTLLVIFSNYHKATMYCDSRRLR
ncbi:hypothetical protein MMC18_001729 [Xylographa bjoerkii]|nr:hypothetical protein [Xylographa bjoerkii]